MVSTMAHFETSRSGASDETEITLDNTLQTWACELLSGGVSKQ